MHDVTPQRSLQDWIGNDTLPFALDNLETLRTQVDVLVNSLPSSVELLGFGEALHGGEEIMVFRNHLFKHLVASHGFCAIAIESSFPHSVLVNEYVAGRGPATYEAIEHAGFSNRFGSLVANRELVEWMRRYNADPSHIVKLRFYGFDMPQSRIGLASPRPVLHFVTAYLASVDSTAGEWYHQRIEPLLGQDSDWENLAAYTDYQQSYGRSPAATALRAVTEDLISALRLRRPEFGGGSDAARYNEALHYADTARQLLNYHAAHAGGAGLCELLSIRDALMADNLVAIVERERSRGKVLAFAHNAHLQRGSVTGLSSWQQTLGAEDFTWWPAGAHLEQLLGQGYAVIGSAVGVSPENGIEQPEADTLEAQLIASPGPARLIPTYHSKGLSAALAALPKRSASVKNMSYIPLSPQSFTDFDWLAIFSSVTYQRGASPLAA